MLKKRLPGDPAPKEQVKRMLRVDHAGEYGAVRIYKGQLAVLGKSKEAPVLKEMAEQERVHLETFDKLLADRDVRPTALMPLWHVAGFALGAGSALLGKNAAMACTVAVEEVIDEHYADQVEALVLEEREPELQETFEKFRLEELEHRDLGIENGAKSSPVYTPLTTVVKTGSKLAIWLSERI
ncbi:MAG: demethoxyubiquinone hydroxylase family protein [Rhodospirillales bacterium]|nr:demethoxyubiquinone hydroxylase family protein [Rhodospirillales bacterium]